MRTWSLAPLSVLSMLSLLPLLAAGCSALHAAVGVAPGLTANAPGSVQVDAGLDMILGPQARVRVARGKHVQVVDPDAACHYGLGPSVRGRFGDGAAVVAPAIAGIGHCHTGDLLGFAGRLGVEALSVGVEDGGTALGLLSPYLELGPRVGQDGAFVDLQGLLGYQVRVVGGPSYPVAGLMLEMTLGIAP